MTRGLDAGEVPEPVKRCSKCGETKPLEAFRRRWTDKPTPQSLCKPCQNKALIAYRQESGREAYNAYHREYGRKYRRLLAAEPDRKAG